MTIIIVGKKDTGLVAYVLNQPELVVQSVEESDITERETSREKKLLEVDGLFTRPYSRNCDDD